MGEQPVERKPAAAAGGLQELDLDEGPVRYAGYAGRLAQFVKVGAAKVSSVRHLAYASDVGEAFRPTVPAWAVNATYAVAVGYVGADVLVQSSKASVRRSPAHARHAPPHTAAHAHQAAGVSDTGVAQTAAQTATFQVRGCERSSASSCRELRRELTRRAQLLASILVPFGAIHTQVHAFTKILKNTPAARHGPSAVRGGEWR